MNSSKVGFAVLGSFLIVMSVWATVCAEDISVGQVRSIGSDIFDQDWSVSVNLPDNYDESGLRYPVLYLLNGQIQGVFLNAISSAGHLSSTGRAPEMIIVGVHTADVDHAFMPFVIDRVPGSGQSARLLEGLNREIIPWIDSAYRSNGFRILAGGSNAGLFTAWASLTQPESFSAYLAPSLSIGWCTDSMTSLAEKCLSDSSYSSPTLYMNYADDDIAGIVLNGAPDFIEIFEREPVGRDRRRSEIIRGGGHVPFISLYNGLAFVFEGFEMPREAALSAGLEGTEDHFRALSEKYGFDVQIPEDVLLNLGVDYYRAERWPETVSAFTRYAELYPTSVRARYLLGAGLEKAGDIQGAIACYQKCLEMDPSYSRAQNKLSNLEENGDTN